MASKDKNTKKSTEKKPAQRTLKESARPRGRRSNRAALLLGSLDYLSEYRCALCLHCPFLK
jgi:hypothetical protein